MGEEQSFPRHGDREETLEGGAAKGIAATGQEKGVFPTSETGSTGTTGTLGTGATDEDGTGPSTPSGIAPAGDASTGNTPAASGSAGNAPTGDASTRNTPAVSRPMGNTPTGNAAAGNVPTGNTPAVSTPAGDAPALSTSTEDAAYDVPRTARGAAAKVLAGRDRREILRRIIDGDPLELSPLVMRRLAARGFLIDGDRLLLRAVARTAHAAPRWHGKPALDEWLVECVDASMEDLVEEDAGTAFFGMAVHERADEHFAFITKAFGVDTPTALQMVATFNSLPEEARLAWHALAVEGKSLKRYVSEGHGPPATVREHVKRAAKALTVPGSTWGAGPDPGRGHTSRPDESDYPGPGCSGGTGDAGGSGDTGRTDTNDGAGGSKDTTDSTDTGADGGRTS